MVVEDFGGLVVRSAPTCTWRYNSALRPSPERISKSLFPSYVTRCPRAVKVLFSTTTLPRASSSNDRWPPTGEQHFRDRELFIAAHGHAARPELVEIVDGEDGVPVVDRGISRSHLVGERRR